MEKKEIIILGAIGNTARQNRDNMRVLNRWGADVCAEKSYRQGSSSCCQESKKKIVVVGDISPDSKHQWSVTYERYGTARTLQGRDWKYPICVVKKYEKHKHKRTNG